jgi:hypothetical protein
MSCSAEDVVQMLGFFIPSIALGVATWQVWVSRKSQREATAAGLYSTYIQMAIEYPKFASGEAWRNQEPVGEESRESYEWYVGLMLHSFEQILLFSAKDDAWKRAIQCQLELHTEYLLSGNVDRTQYSNELQNLMSMPRIITQSATHNPMAVTSTPGTYSQRKSRNRS